MNKTLTHLYCGPSRLISWLRLTMVVLLTAYSGTSFATHLVGGEITYKCIGNYKYEVTIKLYRDCDGVSLSNPSAQTRVRCLDSNGSSAGISLTLVSIRDITPVCKDSSNPCNPLNTYGGKPGIEEHVFRSSIDFNQAPYTSFKNCCKVVFQTQQCCRSEGINTGAGNQNFYIYSELNLCEAPCNSSPTFSSEPLSYMCCNTPYYHYVGAIDTADQDSLSFRLVNPVKAYGSDIPYSSGYSASQPFTPYDTSGTGKVDPDAFPPVGFYIDESNGGVIFTPTRCDEVSVMVFEVTEWRKDSTGVFRVVGKTFRDMTYIIDSCAGNNPPLLSGPYVFNVNEGDTVSFDIESDDKVFVPPPPGPTPDPDSVTLSWSDLFPGATLTILDTTAIHPKAHFEWVAKRTAGKGDQYRFTVTARDNACPMNSVINRSYVINILPEPDTSTSVRDIPPVHIRIVPNPSKGVFTVSSAQDLTVVNVVDMTGKSVSFAYTKNNSGQWMVELKEVGSGIYFIELEYSGYIFIERLMVW